MYSVYEVYQKLMDFVGSYMDIRLLDQGRMQGGAPECPDHRWNIYLVTCFVYFTSKVIPIDSPFNSWNLHVAMSFCMQISNNLPPSIKLSISRIAMSPKFKLLIDSVALCLPKLLNFQNSQKDKKGTPHNTILFSAWSFVARPAVNANFRLLAANVSLFNLHSTIEFHGGQTRHIDIAKWQFQCQRTAATIWEFDPLQMEWFDDGKECGR